MKVVRLAALCTGHLYPPGNIPGNSIVKCSLTCILIGKKMEDMKD
jgi:hypothetical protein